MDQPPNTSGDRSYTGSRLLLPIVDITGLPVDQLNFVFAELLALIFSMLYRRFLPPKPSNILTRHIVASLIGIALSHFCFGVQIWHIITQSSIVYLMLYLIPPKRSYLFIFIFCIVYMSAVHIHRIIYDYGNYTLDISGPLMINTQKLTALAFAFYDGYRSSRRAALRRPDEDGEFSALSVDQETQKLTSIPSPIEYLSYIFYFHGAIVGPLCFFKDYINFIEGRNLLVIPTSRTTNDVNEQEQKPNKIEPPSIFWPVFTKISQCGIWCYFLVLYAPYYPVEYNLSKEMVNSPLYKRLLYLSFSTFCARTKYYFAFILSEAVNNAAGLGFNGFDDKGIPKWDLLTNVRPLKLELATSLKVVIDEWNMQTGLWLRRVCYDRLPKGRTLGVFVLSALWHGFYPGYYACFILAAFETYAGRGIRRQIRPYFQKNQTTKYIYAGITWFGTQIGLYFATTPFLLMEIRKVWYFYQTWYFIVPIISVVLALTLNGASTKPKKNQESSKEKQTKSN